MKTKALAFCSAVLLALAAVPTVASATNSPELVESGTRIEAGQRVQWTNAGNTVMTDVNGNTILSCEVATLTAKVTKNDGANIELDIESANIHSSASSTCAGAFGALIVTTNPATNGLSWCIRSTSAMATDEFQIRGNECTKAPRAIRVAYDLPFGVVCIYQRGAAFTGAFTTGLGKTVLSMTRVEFALLEGGFGCPNATYFDMSFTLETDETGERIDLI